MDPYHPLSGATHGCLKLAEDVELVGRVKLVGGVEVSSDAAIRGAPLLSSQCDIRISVSFPHGMTGGEWSI